MRQVAHTSIAVHMSCGGVKSRTSSDSDSRTASGVESARSPTNQWDPSILRPFFVSPSWGSPKSSPTSRSSERIDPKAGLMLIALMSRFGTPEITKELIRTPSWHLPAASPRYLKGSINPGTPMDILTAARRGSSGSVSLSAALRALAAVSSPRESAWKRATVTGGRESCDELVLVDGLL